MKIMILKEDALNFFKGNCTELMELYKLANSTELLQKFDETALISTKYEIDDFELDMTEELPLDSDIENVKIVYNNLKFLSDSQASDERLWAGLCIDKFWSYVQYRWNIKINCNESNILSHFYFNYSSRRSYTRNAIARLWWIGRLTYDDTRKNPFELTEYVCKHSDYIMHLLERNQSNNINVIKEFLNALIDYESKGEFINTEEFAELTKYLNSLGGSYVIDCLPRDGIYNKILNKIEKMREKNVGTI